mmetsp:Transcript_12194/g.38750  ORF Transcript_12194/g.38750 Transcript_12194/m.38750 type:complete len:214 (+) Transcript_12194:44-685(+)
MHQHQERRRAALELGPFLLGARRARARPRAPRRLARAEPAVRRPEGAGARARPLGQRFRRPRPAESGPPHARGGAGGGARDGRLAIGRRAPRELGRGALQTRLARTGGGRAHRGARTQPRGGRPGGRVRAARQPRDRPLLLGKEHGGHPVLHGGAHAQPQAEAAEQRHALRQPQRASAGGPAADAREAARAVVWVADPRGRRRGFTAAGHVGR